MRDARNGILLQLLRPQRLYPYLTFLLQTAVYGSGKPVQRSVHQINVQIAGYSAVFPVFEPLCHAE
ncbi:hypothetical protein D3C80_2071500 [compost metagenome]